MTSNKINVLMIIPNFHPHVGGAENQLLGLIPYINDEYNVTVLTQKFYKLSNNEVYNNIKIIRRTFVNILSFSEVNNSIGLILFLIKERKNIDIIHFHQAKMLTLIISLFNYLFIKKKSICKIANSGEKFDLYSINLPFKKFLITWFVKSINTFILLNKDVYIKLKGYKPNNILFIPNGVEVSVNFNLLHNQKNKIIFNSRIVRHKNIRLIFQYLLSIEADLQDYEIDVYGIGPELEILKNDSLKFNILKVNFKHLVSNPKQYFKHGDIYINSSSFEGLSNSLLEAMSMGVVPIVSNIPGNIEVVQNDINGLVFNLFDSNSFLNKILSLVIDNNKYYFLSQNAISTIKDKYDFKKISNKYKSLYLDLANENN
jgi:glycosyltransferase involved in cell wall biosynthesis